MLQQSNGGQWARQTACVRLWVGGKRKHTLCDQDCVSWPCWAAMDGRETNETSETSETSENALTLNTCLRLLQRYNTPAHGLVFQGEQAHSVQHATEPGATSAMASPGSGGLRAKTNWEIRKLEVIPGEKRVIRSWSPELASPVVVSLLGSCISECLAPQTAPQQLQPMMDAVWGAGPKDGPACGAASNHVSAVAK